MNKHVNNEPYQQKTSGLGSLDYHLGIYIGNQPDCPSINDLQIVRSAKAGEIVDIIGFTGNHWRKVFSICAKLGFSLWPSDVANWQTYRDEELFQQGSKMALLFSLPKEPAPGKLHLVLGKQYCEKIFPDKRFMQGVDGFPVHPEWNLIQTPYFDYRQLSNQRLEVLIGLIKKRMDIQSL